MLWRAAILPFILVALVTGWLVWQVRQLVITARLVDDADQAIAQANQLLVWLVDKETGLRAYLLTEDPIFLDPYMRARPQAALSRLEHLVSDNEAQLGQLRELRARYARWSDAARESLAAPAEGRSIPVLRSRKAMMDDLRVLVAELVEREEQDRAARAGASERRTTLTFWAVGGLGVCFVLVVSLLSRRQVRTIADLVERERDARRTAEDALRMQDEFLCMLSHELRTPLTPILGWVALLRAKHPPGEIDRALDVIERNTRAEIQLVSDVLDCSHIIAGKLRLTKQVMDLAAVVRDAIEAVKPAAAAKGVALDVVCEPPSLRMVGDPVRLRQVAWNLIGNAIKFTPAGGRVEVRVDLVDSSARIHVRDTGQGIAPESLPRVFDRFWQADSSAKRAHGGLGLGLALAKHLVEAHDGRIEAASEGAGHGATFSVVLPVVPVAPGDIETTVFEAPEAPPAAATELRLDGIRVLVVDDEPFALEVIAAILRERGAEVHAAQSGVQALRLLRSTTVDVMVSDIAMPEMDGYELVQKVRAFEQEHRRSVASVALTAYAAPQDVTRALDSGFQRHLAKPVRPVRLVDTVLDVAHAPS